MTSNKRNRKLKKTEQSIATTTQNTRYEKADKEKRRQKEDKKSEKRQKKEEQSHANDTSTKTQHVVKKEEWVTFPFYGRGVRHAGGALDRHLPVLTSE